jgi:hypothetical protein
LLEYFQNREIAEIVQKSKQFVIDNYIYSKIGYAAKGYAELAGQSRRAEDLMGLIGSYSRRDI